ncbi:hypothetical protein J4050_00200 [Winogradskyella sp. DF17]|jgi:hypothetical protein|uniref:Uncharacterized protein n=1 Tax=Winogradskyella pelagia TaxID=2819984 RepID=A0ABS3SY49_9FLAO|nr:hypothetical protein [Winogradskyella sp. DF17]MBO3115144.1 hypothetical protein [Winogradskyella sp. DF17]
MSKKIDAAVSYYSKQGKEILKTVNTRTDLSADELIRFGEEMAIIEYKLTALEVAKES